MVDLDNEEGPMLVWTFPLVTRLQNRNGLINFSSSATSVESKVQDVKDNSPVRSKVTDVITSDDEDDELNELEDELGDVQQSSESIFGDESDSDDYSQDGLFTSDNTVDMDENTFIPLRTEIDVGEEVEWVNDDDQSHRIVSSNNEKLSSEQIEPGESFTHTFDDSGVTKYFDSMVGGDTMCGAVIVGDATLDEDNLRCEEDVQRELFDDTVDSGSSGRTMSSAVEDKDEMDVGF